MNFEKKRRKKKKKKENKESMLERKGEGEKEG